MKSKYVLFLKEIPEQGDTLSRVGSKAANLGRLAQAGFPVPDGFCVTVDAYDRHISGGVQDKVDEFVGRANMQNIEKAGLIRMAILSAGLPSEIQEDVLAAYKSLSGGETALRVAVRSSSIAEDGAGASYAGQHATYLDVCGEQELLKHIRQCWASLWTEHAASYRSRWQTVQKDGLAVIVQRMAPAEYAGVAFTVDPLTAAPEIVIEAVEGAGEALVSGRASPRRIRVDKNSYEIRALSGKREDGTVPKAQPSALLSALPPALPSEYARRIARLAVEVERYFGSPQDIEWALSGGSISLLQSRPITALAPAALTGEGGQVDMEALLRRAEETGAEIWTDDNVGEVFPDAVTPLTWSVLEPMGNQAFTGFLRRVGARRLPSHSLFGRFYGRVYFNQSQFQRLMSRFYPGRLSHARLRLPGLALAAAAMLEIGARTLLWMWLLPRQADRLVEQLPKDLNRSPYPLDLEIYALWKEIERWQAYGRWAMEVHLAVTIYSALTYTLLEKLVQRWGKGAVETAHLVGGLPGMKSAEMGRDLAALARAAKEQPELMACLQGSGREAMGACLERLPAGDPFRFYLAEFMGNHGHASLHEFELAQPRWREDPGQVLSMLYSHLERRRPKGLGRGHEAQATARRGAAQEMRRRVWFGPKRLFFEGLLNRAQRYSLARENVKYTFIMGHSRLRDLYLSLASRLVEHGLLDEVEDIFYVGHGEIKALMDGAIPAAEAAAFIKSRRAEYSRFRSEQAGAPKIVEQTPDGAIRLLRLPENGAGPLEAARRLSGVGASAGRATGRARVILDPSGAAGLEPGEILVTRAANPAWSPLMLAAGALITEIGGLLSHGAIVAREYGLPAVLNVKDATGLIKNGQVVTVDGTRGVVYLVEE